MKAFLEYKYRDHVIAFSLWLLIFGVYLQTLARTVGFIDSGELATVPFVLGIAHPTGYPFWTLLARLFTLLPLANEEIVRLNIFCALVTSFAAVIFFYVMLSLLRNEENSSEPLTVFVPAAFSALTLAFSQTFWDQSTSVEVYGLHLMMLCAALLFFLRALLPIVDGSLIDQRRWWLFAFTLGLCFTNHLTTILLAPAFLFLFFSVFRLRKEGFRLIVSLILPFALGLSVYLYLPVRAGENPLLNWGHPSTWERILWHVSGKQYRVWMFSSTAAATKQWMHFLDAVPKEFYYFPLLLSLLGAWRLLWHNGRVFIFVALLLVGCVAYTINYDIHDIDSYFLLAYISLAMFAGFGAFEAVRLFRSFSGRMVITAVLGAVVGAELLANWSEDDASGNYLVEDYTANIFAHLQPNAIILSYLWDHFVSASYYFQDVKHIRNDVTVIDKELLRRSWYFMQMEKNHPALYEKSNAEIAAFLRELYKFEHELPYDGATIEARYNAMIDSFVDHNIDSVAVYVTPEIEPHLLKHYIRVPEGLAFRLYKDTLYHPFDFPSLVYRPYRKIDSYTRQLSSLYTAMLTQRAVYEDLHGKRELAWRYLQRAYEIDPNARTRQTLEEYSSTAAENK
jgi:hypothetical protein